MGPFAVLRRAGGPLRSRFFLGLTAIALSGTAIRIAAVLGRIDRVPNGDAIYYNAASNLLVEGKGFINALRFVWFHQVSPSAVYPPGFIVFLAAASLFGFKSFLAHRIWSAILGGLAVAACGLAGREIAGPRVGLLTAAIVAVFPNIWMSNELEMAETVIPLVLALLLLAVYRFWRAPSVWRAGWMGLAFGVAVLTRDELALLGLFVILPTALLAPSTVWRRRLLYLAAACVMVLVSVGPWVGFNMSRFRDPVFISTGLGATLASTDCAQTWYGPDIGFWSFTCENEVPADPGADESQGSADAKSFALKYVRAHESRIPLVALARLGRGFGVFAPLQQIGFDSSQQGRPRHWALTGLYAYWAMLPLSFAGAFMLRRRGVPVFPLVGVALTVAASMVLAFGDTRYRTPFDTCVALLAAVTVDAIVTRLRPTPVPVAEDSDEDGSHHLVRAGMPTARSDP